MHTPQPPQRPPAATPAPGPAVCYPVPREIHDAVTAAPTLSGYLEEWQGLTIAYGRQMGGSR